MFHRLLRNNAAGLCQDPHTYLSKGHSGVRVHRTRVLAVLMRRDEITERRDHDEPKNWPKIPCRMQIDPPGAKSRSIETLEIARDRRGSMTSAVHVLGRLR